MLTGAVFSEQYLGCECLPEAFGGFEYSLTLCASISFDAGRLWIWYRYRSRSGYCRIDVWRTLQPLHYDLLRYF